LFEAPAKPPSLFVPLDKAEGMARRETLPFQQVRAFIGERAAPLGAP
jgi:hypothetical protein